MSKLRVALVSEVFFGAGCEDRLRERLRACAEAGADLVVLPELPLHPWVPATKAARAEDAEPPGGPRATLLGDAARASGVAVLGGVIEREPERGSRHNTALLVGPEGELLGSYRKLHLPEEEGFWETSHYEPGPRYEAPIPFGGHRLGLQICSDGNRPQGCHILAAQGATAVLLPRATEAATWERWRPVLVAQAMTSCCYLLSVNRPAPELGVDLGGPSLVVAPSGEVVAESTERAVWVELDTEAQRAARRRYPGYLSVEPRLYIEGWSGADRHGNPEG